MASARVHGVRDERRHTRLLWRAELGDGAVEHVQVVEEVHGWSTIRLAPSSMEMVPVTRKERERRTNHERPTTH